MKNIIHTIRAAVAVALIATSLAFGAPVNAAPQRPAAEPAVTSDAGQGTCDPNTTGNYHEGAIQNPTLSYSSLGSVGARIDSSGMWACDNWQNSSSGIFAWVGFQPHCPNNCGPFGPDSTIIQFGVGACTYYPGLPAQGPYDMCANHPNTLRYFVAWGGCNGAHPYPQDLSDLSTAWNGIPTYGAEDLFQIVRLQISGVWYYYFYIDGVFTFGIAANISGVSCWAQGDTLGAYDGEVWNEADSFGLVSGGNHVLLYEAKFKNLGETTWRNNTWPTSGNCTYAENPPAPPSVSQHCNFYAIGSTRGMYMWNTVP